MMPIGDSGYAGKIFHLSCFSPLMELGIILIVSGNDWFQDSKDEKRPVSVDGADVICHRFKRKGVRKGQELAWIFKTTEVNFSATKV